MESCPLHWKTLGDTISVTLRPMNDFYFEKSAAILEQLAGSAAVFVVDFDQLKLHFGLFFNNKCMVANLHLEIIWLSSLSSPLFTGYNVTLNAGYIIMITMEKVRRILVHLSREGAAPHCAQFIQVSSAEAAVGQCQHLYTCK